MKRLFSSLLLIGLVLQAPFSYAEKNPRRLLRSLMKVSAGKPIPLELRQSLAKLPPSQLASLTAQLRQANAQIGRAHV